MAQQNINFGTQPNGADGDTIRTAMGKVQANFNELYGGALAVTTFKNRLINGNFDIWQRGTNFPQAAQGIYTADRWKIVSIGTTAGVSQQSFVAGQTAVPGEPASYLRAVVSSVVGASNLSVVQQNIESVRACAGRSMVLSFWAKADGNKSIAVELSQIFGTGGSPSAQVTNIGTKTIALTTAWTKYSVPVQFPSIAGKTLGTGGNDCTQLTFWLDAGSSYSGRTNALGQQSGTFDFAQCQLEEGGLATSFEQRPIGIELAMCQRYARIVQGSGVSGVALSANTILFMASWPTMRSTPSVTLLKTSFASGSFELLVGSTWATGSGCALVSPSIGTQGLTSTITGFSGLTIGAPALINTAGASIFLLDAEL